MLDLVSQSTPRRRRASRPRPGFPAATCRALTAWASTPRALRRSCARSRACSSSASWSTCALRARASTSSCATPPARSRARCGETTGRRSSPAPARAPVEGMQVVVAGRLRLLPGQRHLLPRLLLLGRRPAGRRRGRPARADRAAAPRARRARGCSTRQRCCAGRCCRARSASSPRESGKAREDILAAPRPARLGRAARVGVRARAGPPRRPAIARALRETGRGRRGGGGDRRPRRRLAGGPAVLLRRGAVPHGRAAGGAGDRLGRPPHRPHAARRRRRRQLLDSDARRRGGGAAGLRRARRAASCSTRAGLARAAASTGAARCSRAPACSPRSPARPPRISSASARAAPAVCARCGPARAGACRPSGALTGRRALVLQRKASSAAARLPRRRPAELERLRARARRPRPPAHARARLRARRDRASGEPIATAAAARRREREVRLRFADDDRPCEDRREMSEDRRASAEPASAAAEARRPTRARPRASRRSSAGSTPARPSLERDARAGARGQGADRVLRARARGRRRRAGGAAPGRAGRRAWKARRAGAREHLRAARRAAAADRGIRARSGTRSTFSNEFVRKTTVIRLHGAGEKGLGEDVTYAAEDQEALQRAGPTLPLAGSWTLDVASPSTCARSISSPPTERPEFRLYRNWAFDSAALDLALRQAGTTLHAALGRECAAAELRRLAASGRAADARAGAARLRIAPGLRFKLDPTPSWDEQLIAGLVDAGGRRVGRPEGPVRGHDRRQPRRPGAVSPCGRGVPGRVDRGSEADRGDRTDPAPPPRTDHLGRADPLRRRHRALPFPPRTLNIKPSRLGGLRSLLDVYDYCAANDIGCYGGGQSELSVGRGQIQYLASLFHPDAPNDVAPAVSTCPSRRPTCPPARSPRPPPRSAFAGVETSDTQLPSRCSVCADRPANVGGPASRRNEELQ